MRWQTSGGQEFRRWAPCTLSIHRGHVIHAWLGYTAEHTPALALLSTSPARPEMDPSPSSC